MNTFRWETAGAHVGGASAPSALAERCNRALVESGDAGRNALRQLEEAARSDERLHTFIKSPLLSRPGLFASDELAPLERDMATLLELLTSLPARLFDGSPSPMCEQVGISGAMRGAVLATADETSVMLARADVVRSADGPKVIEFNVHSSLGGMDIGPLNETFLKIPVFADFLSRQALTYMDPLDSIVAELEQAMQARGMTGAPTVALVDWPTTYPTYEAVLERVCALFRGRGLDAVHTHVGVLEARNGYLWCGNRRIDVLYRIFMLEDIPEQPELIEPILEAHRAGRVLLAMSFVGELVGNKASLALLSEASDPDLLTTAEREAVDRILPQTRLLRPGRTTWHGEPRDLFELAVTEQTRLVLKPAIGHGTLGVVPGWAVTEGEWKSALAGAAGGVYVLQERVKAVPEVMPSLRGDDWEMHEYDVNWGVFMHDGRFAGAMLRAVPSSRSGLISLGAGGSVGCCFFEEGTDG